MQNISTCFALLLAAALMSGQVHLPLSSFAHMRLIIPVPSVLGETSKNAPCLMYGMCPFSQNGPYLVHNDFTLY